VSTKNFVKIINFFLLVIAGVYFFDLYKIHALTPSINNKGAFCGDVGIRKANVQETGEKNVNQLYGPANMNIINLEEQYKEVGKVYYKQVDGSWTDEKPLLTDPGHYDISYFVKGNQNHNDLGSPQGPKHLIVDIDVDKTSWGDNVLSIPKAGITNYKAPDGRFSAEVTGNEVIWLHEESDGTGAWYGLDNRSGVFRTGSRFWVKWLDPEDDKEEWEKYAKMLDKSFDDVWNLIDEGKIWIFLTGVTDPDGNEYGQLNTEVPYYIQLGEDWDKEDVLAMFVSDDKNEKIDVTFVDVAGSNSRFDNINFPVTKGEFARLLLSHFSPYVILDTATPSYSSVALDESISKSDRENDISYSKDHSYSDYNGNQNEPSSKNDSQVYNYNGPVNNYNAPVNNYYYHYYYSKNPNNKSTSSSPGYYFSGNLNDYKQFSGDSSCNKDSSKNKIGSKRSSLVNTGESSKFDFVIITLILSLMCIVMNVFYRKKYLG